MTPARPCRTRRPGWIACAAMAASLGASGCAGAAAGPTSAVPNGGLLGTAVHPSLDDAIAQGRDLGPVPSTTVLRLTLGLAGQDPAGLAALLGEGGQVSPAEYASRFGPDPAAVARVEARLVGAGLTPTWTAGEATLTVSGAAAAVERLVGVRIDDRQGPDGTRFYAPAAAPPIPASLAPEVDGITGLDDYPLARTGAIRSPNGVSPSDMLDFYDVNKLRQAGFNGQGMTVAFMESGVYQPAMLAEYAKRFNLPAFDVQSEPRRWGQPEADPGDQNSGEGEADLDLEIVHAIAPAAKEVVYYFDGTLQRWVEAQTQMYKDYPSGAIESVSMGVCEPVGGKSFAQEMNGIQAAAAAQGWSIFVSTGDRGAYGCTPWADSGTSGYLHDLAVQMPASGPSVTAVGGTDVMLSSTGGYFQEAAWGEPIEQWGSGGGLSTEYQRPSWQNAPGVDNQYSDGERQVPDVSANADIESGWDVFSDGTEQPIGGTSASTPFWAACAALIDQDLKASDLPLIGFANPALYYLARATQAQGLPAPAFHQVTEGDNLYYPATPGWNYATGLGTPDVGALADDLVWYGRNHPTTAGS